MQLKKIIKNIESIEGRKNNFRQTFNEILPIRNAFLKGGGRLKNLLYFYDDNFNNFTNHNLCPHIQFNLMNKTKNLQPTRYDKKFLNLFDKTSDAYTLAEFIILSNKNKYDPKSGREVLDISSSQIVDFYTHVETAAFDTSIDGFVFDWDHTLQVLSRMSLDLKAWATLLQIKDELTKKQWKRYKKYIKKSKHNFELTNLNFFLKNDDINTTSLLGFTRNSSIIDRSLEALSIIHAGGSDRRKKLQSMFKIIHENKKTVIILSANPKILKISEVFKGILKKWGCKDCTLFYSKQKYRFMQSLQELQQYCI